MDLPRYNYDCALNRLMKKATKYHARLHILLARDAKTGIIIRRGAFEVGLYDRLGSDQGLVGTRRLFDFTPMGFEAIAAPY
jgi:hypothetical protein